jgi:hypothetical protein
MALWDALELLFTLKRFIHDEEETTLAHSFGPGWSGIKSPSTFECAKARLIKLGIIQKVGVNHGAAVWAPGPGIKRDIE